MKIKPPSIIDEIVLSVSNYHIGTLEIRLKPSRDEEVANNLDLGLRSLEDPPIDSLGVPPFIYYFNISSARKTIDYLWKQNLISTGERADLASEINESDKKLTRQQHLIQHTTKSIDDVLKFMCDPYIEAVFAVIDDPFQTLTLLSYPLSKHYNQGYSQNEMMQYITSIAPSSDKDKHIAELLETLTHLNLICWGNANLESTFIRSSEKLPDLRAQRRVIARLFMEAYLTKFLKLPAIDKFHATAVLYLLTCQEQRHMYPKDMRELLKDVMNKHSRSWDWQLSFRSFGGLYDFINDAIYQVRQQLSLQELGELRTSLITTYPEMEFNDDRWYRLYPKLETSSPSNSASSGSSQSTTSASLLTPKIFDTLASQTESTTTNPSSSDTTKNSDPGSSDPLPSSIPTTPSIVSLVSSMSGSGLISSTLQISPLLEPLNKYASELTSLKVIANSLLRMLNNQLIEIDNTGPEHARELLDGVAKLIFSAKKAAGYNKDYALVLDRVQKNIDVHYKHLQKSSEKEEQCIIS